LLFPNLVPLCWFNRADEGKEGKHFLFWTLEFWGIYCSSLHVRSSSDQKQNSQRNN
jgi:hypothetical protein